MNFSSIFFIVLGCTVKMPCNKEFLSQILFIILDFTDHDGYKSLKHNVTGGKRSHLREFQQHGTRKKKYHKKLLLMHLGF